MFLPLNSNSAMLADETTNTIPASSVLPIPAVKGHLLLPKTAEGWEAANQHFSTTLVPAVLGASSLSEKYSTLIDGIYSYFQSTCGSRAVRASPLKKRRPLHNTSLKEVKKQKKAAKLELRGARQQGLSPDAIQSIVQKFIALVRSHSKLKKSAEARSAAQSVKDARDQCHKRLASFAKEFLDGGPSGNIVPAFTAEKAYNFFSEVYQSAPREFSQPGWLPSPPVPQVAMDCSPFSIPEVAQVIKRMKSASAPSPFDRVGYVIFKRCPALMPALVDLFNLCWTLSLVPQQWKTAAIKLLAKGPAADDATNPANFRPIALTPCVGKIFTTLLRNRWLKFMLRNDYFDPSLQKAFLPNVPGCTEHQLKLSSILKEAQEKHKALAVCWLDLANAYGSVHHSLIEFSLRHYHAPPQFLSILHSLYSGLNGIVTTKTWETPLVSLQKGVYQGDPLSVVIFNTVMNTLVDTISLRIDLGYQFSGSQRRVNILQYADDTCLVANSPAACQHLLSTVADWLEWSGMAAKIPKCQCVSLKGSTGKLVDPQLCLHGEVIPFTTDPVRFLGLNVQAPSHNTSSRPAIISKLD